MSDRTALSELASFVGRSPLAAPDMSVRNTALRGVSSRMLGRKRTVGELLSVVLTLSARTRRMGQPLVRIDLDVFSPGGARAMRMTLGGGKTSR
jgi:hypothetical protein